MSICSFIKAEDARNFARDLPLLYEEICAIQQAILAAINNGEYSTIVAGGTPMTATNSVVSVTVTDPGTDYFPIEATAVIVHPFGVNADVEPIVEGTTVTGFVINDGGTGYDPVSATANMTGSGNADASIQPIVVDGVIVGVVIVDAGTGYLVGDAVPIVHPAGSGADLEVGSVGGGGEILSVTINDGGEDYQTINATVDVLHPLGQAFEGVVQVAAGVVTGINIIDGGFLYAPLLPTATVSDASGTGAVLEVEVDEMTGEVTGINVLNGGFGYSANPTVDIDAASGSLGTGATADAVVDFTASGLTSSQYYNVVSGQSSDRVLKDQIQFVLDYFTKLGYNIRGQVNPATGNTLQWQVIW